MNYNKCDVKACGASIPQGENYQITFVTKDGDSHDRDVCVKCYKAIYGLMFYGWRFDED